MKNLVLTLVFIFSLSLSIYSQQHSFSFGADPAVGLYGGHLKVNGLDYMIRYSYNNSYEDVWSNDEVGLFYERFNKLNFGNFGVFFNKVVYPKINNTELAFGIEGSIIHRDIWEFKNENMVHHYFWSYGFNLEPRYYFGNNIYLSLLANLKRRTDIEKWVYSNYILLSFKF